GGRLRSHPRGAPGAARRDGRPAGLPADPRLPPPGRERQPGLPALPGRRLRPRAPAGRRPRPGAQRELFALAGFFAAFLARLALGPAPLSATTPVGASGRPAATRRRLAISAIS